jgi:hypothetical protein
METHGKIFKKQANARILWSEMNHKPNENFFRKPNDFFRK